jgi:hypothetical protein
LTALLRWSCAALFFGRAWQHLRWDAPFRSLLWSQDTMEGIVHRLLGLDWQTFATSPTIAAGIATLIKSFGVFYLFCGVAAVLCTPTRRWAQALLILGSVALTFLSYCYYRDKLYRLGEFGEYATQFTLPLLFVWWVCGTFSRDTLLGGFRVAVALTFSCHGLYAVGFYPTPGEWITMTTTLTGLGDADAFRFVRAAGVLDFVVAGLIFAPWRGIALPALAYTACWGLATAFARSAAFVRWENFSDSTTQWLHETIIRLPHATVPLVLFLALRGAINRVAPSPAPTSFPPGPFAPASPSA